jgi:hypothetical protein
MLKLEAIIMRKIMFSVLAIAFMATNGYCGETEARVTLKTDKNEYAVGERITVTITNNSAKPIHHHDICAITLCEHGERSWHCSEKDCYSSRKTLAPGDFIKFRYKVNAPYKKGALGIQRYKFEYYEDAAPEIKTIYSNEFTVKDQKRLSFNLAEPLSL